MMSSQQRRISMRHLWWGLGLLALACVWLVYAELQPVCEEHFVSWYTDCKQSQRAKLLFWWPIVVTGSIVLSSLLDNYGRVASSGQRVLVAWLRYLGSLVIGVGVWICLFLLSTYLTKLRFASQFGGEAAGWLAMIFWGGLAVSLILSIPLSALAFFLGHRQWQADYQDES